MTRFIIAAAASSAALFGVPAAAQAYSECGNPPGAAANVTAAYVSCSDARAFARKVAGRHVSSSRWVSLPGWRAYYARVRRSGGRYDVRATRGRKVIRFQYRAGSSGGGGGNCDPNYSGCLDPSASDYDCAGGSGNGPRYTGEVQVLGDDHFDLDRDGDGTACDT
jgi:hypothetical protein